MLRLMLVDDEPNILHGIARMIERGTKHDIAIQMVDTAKMALELCIKQCPDLLITDIYMPEMDGFQLIEQVASHSRCKRFAILSGYSDFELARRAMHVKTMEYLTKPVDTEELIHFLESVKQDVEQEKQIQHQHFFAALRGALFYGITPETMCTSVEEDWFTQKYVTIVTLEVKEPLEVIFSLLSRVKHFFSISYILDPQDNGRPLLIGASSIPCDEHAILDEFHNHNLGDFSCPAGVYCGNNNWNTLQEYYRQSLENARYDAFFKNDSPLEANLSSPVSIVKAYLRSHYREDITLETLAQKARLHPNYLSTLFKKEAGMSFRQYLNRFRILKACEQIQLHPELSFETLAILVGYDNPRQFFKMFKEHTGTTPGQYRHKHKGGLL